MAGESVLSPRTRGHSLAGRHAPQPALLAAS